MFFELIGTLVAGVAAAILVWALNRPLKGRLPKWLAPVAAGGAMLYATISSEYGWFARTTAVLPNGMVVADAIEERAIYRPWTYAKPYVTRFVAVDLASVQTHENHPNQRIVDLVFYGRWSRTAVVPMLFDCAAKATADIVDGVEFAADGAVVGAQWRKDPSEVALIETACEMANG